MDKLRVKYLLLSFVDKTITPQEQSELLDVIENHPEAEFTDLISEIIDASGREEISIKDWTRLITNATSADKPAVQVKTIFPIYRFAAAASVLLVIGIGLYLFSAKEKLNNSALIIKPGTNKAVLITADGSSVALDGDLQREEVLALGKTIKSVTDGEIVYNNEDLTTSSGLNRLVIPKGGQYRVVLPDKSVVWLNSDSELKYPSAFQKDSRVVELTGEAYFEITSHHKKWPFIVKTASQQVEVLGTKFNVSAYDEDNLVTTSLLEGKVKVQNQNTKQEMLISPGQEVTLYKSSNEMNRSSSVVEEAIAWKDGLFVFNNEDIHVAMAKIARWYNIEVLYKDDLKGKAFWGTASRSDKLESLLKTLQATGVAKFKIEGRRVLVMR